MLNSWHLSYERIKQKDTEAYIQISLSCSLCLSGTTESCIASRNKRTKKKFLAMLYFPFIYKSFSQKWCHAVWSIQTNKSLFFPLFLIGNQYEKCVGAVMKYTSPLVTVVVARLFTNLMFTPAQANWRTAELKGPVTKSIRDNTMCSRILHKRTFVLFCFSSQKSYFVQGSCARVFVWIFSFVLAVESVAFVRLDRQT